MDNSDPHFNCCFFSLHILTAPSVSVSNLTVQQYTEDDKALIVSWERANLTPPEGPVSHYLVVYRDAQQALSNVVRVPPETSFLVLWDISNANDYEVSIHICIYHKIGDVYL